MTASAFVDTNVLVYAYDRSEAAKQQRARGVLTQLATTQSGVISTQVLAEFFNAVTRKIAAPLSIDEGYTRVQNFVHTWQVVNLTGTMVLEAIRGVREHQFGFWDAQIWAAARLNQIPVVFSEDFAAGAVVEGVRFVNPLAEDFELETWM